MFTNGGTAGTQGGSLLVAVNEGWGWFPAWESFTCFVTWTPLSSLMKPMDLTQNNVFKFIKYRGYTGNQLC